MVGSWGGPYPRQRIHTTSEGFAPLLRAHFSLEDEGRGLQLGVAWFLCRLWLDAHQSKERPGALETKHNRDGKKWAEFELSLFQRGQRRGSTGCPGRWKEATEKATATHTHTHARTFFLPLSKKQECKCLSPPSCPFSLALRGPCPAQRTPPTERPAGKKGERARGSNLGSNGVGKAEPPPEPPGAWFGLGLFVKPFFVLSYVLWAPGRGRGGPCPRPWANKPDGRWAGGDFESPLAPGEAWKCVTLQQAPPHWLQPFAFLSPTDFLPFRSRSRPGPPPAQF